MDKKFSYEDMDHVIVRNHDSVWVPAFFCNLNLEFHEGRPFGTYENYYEFVAVLEGNESEIGTQDDVYGLWDMDRLIAEGFLDEWRK